MRGFALALGPATAPVAIPGWMRFGRALPGPEAVADLRRRLADDGVEVVESWDEPVYVLLTDARLYSGGTGIGCARSASATATRFAAAARPVRCDHSCPSSASRYVGPGAGPRFQ